MNNDRKIETMVLTALFTAMIAVVTIAIPVPIPFTNGYIHLGDSMIFLSVMILGWKRGAVAAGVGSAFADLILGYIYWVPWTLVIKGGMALIMGLLLIQSGKSKKRMTLSCLIIVVFWLLFNLAVNVIIRFEESSNPTALIEGSGVSSVSEFGAFLNQIQGWLMASSLIIPIILIVVTIIMRKSNKYKISMHQVVAMTGAGIFMVFGYYLAGGILLGNFAVSAFSVPANIAQFVVGFIIAIIVFAALSKTPLGKRLIK